MDEEDELLGWDLPMDDIEIASELIPAYQDEEDECECEFVCVRVMLSVTCSDFTFCVACILSLR